MYEIYKSADLQREDPPGDKDELIDTKPIIYSRKRVKATSKEKHKYFCTHCVLGYTRLFDLKRHYRIKHGELEMPTNAEIIQFKVCESADNASVDLKARFRRTKSAIDCSFFCDLCPRGFTRKHDMEKHRRCKHFAVTNDVEGAVPSRRRVPPGCELVTDPTNGASVYKCTDCGRVFKRRYEWERHQTVHSGEKKFFCHICGKSFRLSTGLKRHINEHHLRVKKFACELCGNTFGSKVSLQEHTNIHTGERPWVCDICGKAFKQRASLRIHKLFHSDECKFKCLICGKGYRRAQELKVHGWKHTGHKPQACPKCNATFRLRQDLLRHLKIHYKVEECVCELCGTTFSQQRYLKNHMKVHTGVRNKKQATKKTPAVS